MKKRIALLCMLCGVLVLSGCGGSGRVDDLERRVNVAEPLVEQLRRDLEIAETEAETAKTAAEAARLTADAAQTRARLAEAAAAQATEDKATAEEDARQARAAQATAEEDARQARAAQATAEEDARQARAALATAQTGQEQARAEQERQQREAEARLSEAQQAVLNARARAYIGELDDNERRGDDTAGSIVTVEWMRDERIEVDPGGNFAPGSGAPSISGFSAYHFTRRTGISDETAYLYTNIQSPGTRAFWKAYGLDETLTATNASLAMPSSTGTSKVYTGSGATRVFAGRSVGGSFRGASGTFTCSATDDTATHCGVTVTTDINGNPVTDNITSHIETVNGVRRFASGTAISWTFKPSNINNGVRINQDDTFLYFGIWASEPDIASGAHNFQVIHGGGGVKFDGDPPVAVLDSTAFGDLTGSATFKGGAIGKYVTRNQVGENARIGTFTAQADFTANFNGANSSLEGRITNFREDGQELAGWDVYLGGTSATDASVFEGGTTAAGTGSTAHARIGRVAATGTWAATLYGSANNRADLGGGTAPDADDPTYPLARFPFADLAGVAGHFSAVDLADDPATTNVVETNAAIAGAFAATPSN